MRKALLIGINKYPTPNELNGCVHDVEQMRELAEIHGHGEFRIGPVLTFDGETQQFAGEHAKQANTLLRRQDRQGFEVKEIEPTATAAG